MTGYCHSMCEVWCVCVCVCVCVWAYGERLQGRPITLTSCGNNSDERHRAGIGRRPFMCLCLWKWAQAATHYSHTEHVWVTSSTSLLPKLHWSRIFCFTAISFVIYFAPTPPSTLKAKSESGARRQELPSAVGVFAQHLLLCISGLPASNMHQRPRLFEHFFYIQQLQ